MDEGDATRGLKDALRGALAGLAQPAGRCWVQASSSRPRRVVAVPREAPRTPGGDGHQHLPAHAQVSKGTVSVSHAGTLKLGVLSVLG